MNNLKLLTCILLVSACQTTKPIIDDAYIANLLKNRTSCVKDGINIIRDTPTDAMRIEPIYPNIIRKVNGKVNLEYTVNTEGLAENIKIISSRPGTTFNQASIEAIQKWKFFPKCNAGVAVSDTKRTELTFHKRKK